MKRLKAFFHRLDTQLSMIVGGTVVFWFVSFLISASLINYERVEKNTYLEKERIQLRVEAELTHLLNDVLLDHRKSLELILQDLHQSLGLSWIELRYNGKQLLKYGVRKANSERFVLQQQYPIRFDSKEYGTLTLGKELWILNGSERVPLRWILGIAVVMFAIFYLVRRFVQKQVVTPLGKLIQYFGEEGTGNELVVRSHSAEMDELVLGFRRMRERMNEYQARSIEAERQAALGELAAQVAHDIRSPLTALSVVNEHLSELPESKRVLVRSAVQRIRDIANNLLEKKNSSNTQNSLNSAEETSVYGIGNLIEGIVSENRLQFKSTLGIEIQTEFTDASYGLFAKVQPTVFKSIVSNLIGNAVESISGKGRVHLWLSAKNGAVTLRINDNGVGIPNDIQSKLFEKGATFNKIGGSGLGLFHARESITRWGGRISLESVGGKGTCITVLLPEAAKPLWFVDKLKVGALAVIGVLDDDESIHHTWRRRFEMAEGTTPTLVHFSKPDELAAWLRDPKNRASLYLIDYEMRAQMLNGLDVIESLNLEKESILVTSHSDEPEILSRCESLGVRVLPKSLADSVPIEL